MAEKIETLSEKIVETSGGADNISSIGSCMTRLRFTLKDESKNTANYKQISGVLGYLKTGTQHQIILGPGVCAQTAEYISKKYSVPPLNSGAEKQTTGELSEEKQLTENKSSANSQEQAGTKEDKNIKTNSNQNTSAQEEKNTKTDFSTNIPAQEENAAAQIGKSKEVKTKIKKKYASALSKICSKIGNIFLPLIPAYIACGLILGVNNILSKTLLENYPNITALLAVFGNGIFFYLSAIVGYNANKEFGGTPALGVVFAGILTMPALNGLTLFGISFSAGKGGIIAVLAVCYFGSLFEKLLKKHLKGGADMFLTPTLTVLTIGFLSLLMIQPAAGYLSDKLALYTQKAIEHGGIFTGFILAGSFLPVVMLGIHQSLIPLYQQLIDTLGNNPLFPILCMAGAGQVGASIAVWVRTKNTRLKAIIKNALPVGILGIGEPLIYGVTLPLFKPFIAACIGAAFGGAVIAASHTAAAIPFGVSGIVLLLAMSNLHSTIFYFIGLITAAAAGFAAALILGFEDPRE